MLSRRQIFGVSLAAAGGLSSLSRPALALAATGDRAEWQSFRERFIAPDGRVVDDGNGGISHSEGQGWAMLLSESFNDRETFDRALGFLRQQLKRPTDSLHAWRYKPNQAQPVDDLNNATDGDLFVAWALLRAAARWQRPELHQMAVEMGRDILRLVVRRVGDRTVLLPGAYGFEKTDHVVVNPSYYMFGALRALGAAVPDRRWVDVQADGLDMLEEARFGRWQLTPDWLRVPRAAGRLSPAQGWPARFSFDAVRVPLYLVWSGLVNQPAVGAAVGFWTDPKHRYQPAWTDLTSNDLSPYPASTGMQAVARVVGSAGMLKGAALQPVRFAHDYYAASLTMLSLVAARDANRV
jgi:endo-1,4-beta-D-glucanase Y